MRNDLFFGKAGMTAEMHKLTEQVSLLSVLGGAKAITTILKAALDREDIKAVSLIAMGINGRGDTLHLLIAYTQDGQPLADAQLTLGKRNVSTLLGTAFYYASFITTLQDGVTVAAFDQDFVPTDTSGKIYCHFANAIIDNARGKIRGADQHTRTLLLVGRTPTRTLVASRHGNVSPLSIIETPADASTIGQEYGIIGGHTVLAADRGGNKIHALNVTSLASHFKRGTPLNWTTRQIDITTIEGISLPIGASQTVLITGQHAINRIIVPATISWTERLGGAFDNFRIKLHMSDAVATNELHGWAPAPMRLNPTTNLLVGRSNEAAAQFGVRRLDVIAPSGTRLRTAVDKAADGSYAFA